MAAVTVTFATIVVATDAMVPDGFACVIATQACATAIAAAAARMPGTAVAAAATVTATVTTTIATAVTATVTTTIATAVTAVTAAIFRICSAHDGQFSRQ